MRHSYRVIDEMTVTASREKMTTRAARTQSALARAHGAYSTLERMRKTLQVSDPSELREKKRTRNGLSAYALHKSSGLYERTK